MLTIRVVIILPINSLLNRISQVDIYEILNVINKLILYFILPHTLN